MGLTYYINRSAAGCLWIVYPMAMILCGIIASEIIEYNINSEGIKDIIKIRNICAGLRFVSIVFISGITVCVTSMLYSAIVTRVDYDSANSTTELVLYNISEITPNDTPILGTGGELINAYLQRNDKYNLTSEAYIRKEAVEKYKELLLNGEPKIICKASVSGYIMAGYFEEDILEKIDCIYDNQVLLGDIEGNDYWYMY